MREEDKNFAYLIKMMRKKYGRRDNMFRIQQRLAERLRDEPDQHRLRQARAGGVLRGRVY
ncbi:hypothetical protein PR002_g12095 [Phytophthora rubi]|uniref:Uncharacterized protein n=1 Tax=Phytophthora rubi TaxID=129364 RepID=A0A6A3LUX7_9STRA|nr:hypothetical protein PR002_g12095 [Phytophthora rubi]